MNRVSNHFLGVDETIRTMILFTLKMRVEIHFVDMYASGSIGILAAPYSLIGPALVRLISTPTSVT